LVFYEPWSHWPRVRKRKFPAFGRFQFYSAGFVPPLVLLLSKLRGFDRGPKKALPARKAEGIASSIYSETKRES